MFKKLKWLILLLLLSCLESHATFSVPDRPAEISSRSISSPTSHPTFAHFALFVVSSSSDPSGSLQGAGGVGGLIALVTADDTYVYCMDANGNVVQMLDASDGSVEAQYEYSPFGELTASSGAMADENPFRFSTKYWDIETGLGYWGMRYYHPEQGRWLSRDPLGEEGGLLLYGFVGNDPVGGVDLLGLDWKEIEALARDHNVLRVRDFVLLKCGGMTTASEFQNERDRLYRVRDEVLSSASLSLTEMAAFPSTENEYVRNKAENLEFFGTRCLGPLIESFEEAYSKQVKVDDYFNAVALHNASDPVARLLTLYMVNATAILAAAKPQADLSSRGPRRLLCERSTTSAQSQGGQGSGARYIYDAKTARYRDLSTGRFIAQHDLPYPSNRGFVSSVRRTLGKGTIIDRYGPTTGRYAGQPGASISSRGMPSGSEALQYTRYRVTTPLEAEVGPASAVSEFGASGGATQFGFDLPLDELVLQGFLEVLP